jgi:hypothetical protein
MQTLIVIALISFITVCLIIITSTVVALGWFIYLRRQFRNNGLSAFSYPAYHKSENPPCDPFEGNPFSGYQAPEEESGDTDVGGFSPNDPDWWKNDPDWWKK